MECKAYGFSVKYKNISVVSFPSTASCSLSSCMVRLITVTTFTLTIYHSLSLSLFHSTCSTSLFLRSLSSSMQIAILVIIAILFCIRLSGIEPKRLNTRWSFCGHSVTRGVCSSLGWPTGWTHLYLRGPRIPEVLVHD